MPKSKATNNIVVEIGQTRLVDAEAIGAHIGFTPKWVSEQAREGRIPWHGIRNGTKVYRRFNLEEVLAALAHDVEAFDGDSAQPARVSHVPTAKPTNKTPRTGRQSPRAHDGAEAMRP
jgi:hypothetical protein